MENKKTCGRNKNCPECNHRGLSTSDYGLYFLHIHNIHKNIICCENCSSFYSIRPTGGMDLIDSFIVMPIMAILLAFLLHWVLLPYVFLFLLLALGFKFLKWKLSSSVLIDNHRGN